jgi:hypothetical protein
VHSNIALRKITVHSVIYVGPYGTHPILLLLIFVSRQS